MTAFLWPVFSFANPSNPVVAYFFHETDAADFVTENLGQRNLYLASPKYDRRAKGYRAPIRFTETTVIDLGDGHFRAEAA